MIGSLAFLNPWALLSLLALPALYLLLRITPPAPKTIQFPAARFLADLKPKQNTPNHTPWWILLLRILIAALLLLALAQPVLNPAQTSQTSGPVLILVDNGWSAAENWEDIQSTGENHIKQAGRQNRSVYVLSTAPEAGAIKPAFEPQTASDALSTLRGLKPHPWPTDFKSLLETTKNFRGSVIWLSDGIEKKTQKQFLRQLDNNGASVEIYSPQDSALPFILKPPKSLKEQPTILVDGAYDVAFTRTLRVQLLGQRGNILDEIDIGTKDQSLPIEAVFDLPLSLQNSAASFRIAGQKGAGTRYLLDSIGGPKTVGIVAPEEQVQTRKLTEDSFYLGKAMEPYATVFQGSLDGVIAEKPSIIILPDIANMPPESLNALSEWVSDGGLLLRFAGPNMTQARERDILTPVPLRREARSVEGSLSWDKPLKIKPPMPESPLYGLGGFDEIEVSGQILPQASETLDERTWLQLEDGTPLITAGQKDAGLIVMVHTAASPTWSNLPLSGFYVQFLKRLLKFSGQSTSALQNQSGLLQPDQMLDGFGEFTAPEPSVKPLDAVNIEEQSINPDHPPGYYGRGGLRKAFNLGDHIVTLRSVGADTQYTLQNYGQQFETNLVPHFITTALLLLLLDGLIMLVLSRSQIRILKPAALAVLFICIAQPAYAQSASEDLYLAYIKTGNPAIDATSKKGLEVLAAALNGRTSAEPKGVKAVNPEKDTLAFFPLLYWPLSNSQAEPGSLTIQKLQDYLDHGGTILVDTRDGSGNPENLRRMIGNLNIPPLMELPKDHVLGKSFYLLESFPGRTEGAPIWVEGQSINGRDGVSSVIIGSHDWAGAWAELSILKRGSRQYIQGATERHEMSVRFGINLVMYALTGNYKADQVHVPHILERLGHEE